MDSDAKICADCGAENAEWASLNRGVFVCNECCYVHQSLGRHISQIRSLRKGVWCQSQLELITTLNRNGVNNIWEHFLVDPQNQNKSRKKPVSNDPVFPKKDNFIRRKYLHNEYTIKPTKEERTSLDDLNRQLWSCVRTGHVETTLRLLALGGDPNYADQDKGNTPLHVAAKEGQVLQVELLAIYGADVGQKNAAGLLPMEVARQEGHNDLAERLEELEFDVTDRFSMFLCGRKPEHLKGQHFLISEMANPSDQCKEFRRQLQTSSCVLFEKLVQDVFDELDRREVAAQWSAVQGIGQVGRYDSNHVAVFLPPNPALSATRNQLRQKLAKYDSRDFAQLIIDLLKEARRRFLGQDLASTEDSTDRWSSELNQTAREYEDVADLAMDVRKSRGSSGTHRSSANKTSDDLLDHHSHSNPTLDDFLELREKLQETDHKLTTVVQTYVQMSKDMQLLQKTVEQMFDERKGLEGQLSGIREQLQQMARRNAQSPLPQRPFSPPNAVSPVPRTFTQSRYMTAPQPEKKPVQRQASLNSAEPNRADPTRTAALTVDSHLSQAISTPSGLNDWTQQQNKQQQHRLPPQFPDDLIKETEHLIAAIKNLLADLQQHRANTNAIFHADNIDYHIKGIISTVPPPFRRGPVQDSIEQILLSMRTLHVKCAQHPLNTDETCHSAYSVAQAAKTLLLNANNAADQVPASH